MNPRIAAVSMNRQFLALTGKVRQGAKSVLSAVRFIAVLGVVIAIMPVAYAGAPTPLLAPGVPVDWWFVFKFNAAAFPGCDGGEVRQCVFGGEAQDYQFGQQFVYASSDQPKLQKGSGCVGANVRDPLGATVEQIYAGAFHFVVWNDQFYDDPKIAGCTKSCSSPWGHSKGMLAWDDSGAGVVLQVSTPSWPAAGSSAHPRKSDGNTLGCVGDDDVKVSQHFFALKLSKEDVVSVLDALQNASVVTDVADPQIVANGGPADVQDAVRRLGRKSKSTRVIDTTLSSGVQLIGKASALHVPPWQLVSSELGGVALRTATWWAPPRIPSTTAASVIKCWDVHLHDSGPVEVATSGEWDGTTFSLKGGPAADNNHAKIGVTVGEADGFAIFGDLNQQGTLTDADCGRSQNGRGGLFFAVRNPELSKSVGELIHGESAATE
jgi:Deoxyribonuclease II